MLETASSKLKDFPNVKVYKCPASKISKQNGEPYDYITSSAAFHFFNVEATLERIREVLADDGVCAVYCYVTMNVRDPTKN